MYGSELQKWLKERAKLSDEGSALLTLKETQGRLSPDDQLRLDHIKSRRRELNTVIAAHHTAHGTENLDVHEMPRIAAPPGYASPSPGLRQGAKYGELFPDSVSTDGWQNVDEYFATIHNGLNDSRLRATHTEGNPSTGGFSVPEEYVRDWLDSSLQNEVVRPRAKVYPMNSDTLRVPGWDDSDHSSGDTAGGLRGTWLSENTTAVDDDGTVRLIQLNAKKLALFSRASNELISDGLGFEQQLGQAMIDSVGFSLDWCAINGTGAGQMLGILNSGAKISVDKETGQSADTINYTNLVKMLARMYPRGVMNSVFLAHPSTIEQLASLSLAVGTGGSAIQVMSESASSGRFRILTREVIFTEHCRELGDEGDIILADLSQYVIGLRKDVSLEKSQHVGWQSDTTGYRAIMRVDGQPAWAEAQTLRYGSDSVSPFIVLAERS